MGGEIHLPLLWGGGGEGLEVMEVCVHLGLLCLYDLMTAWGAS